MANTDFRTVGPIGADLYSVDTTPQFPLGTILQGKSPTLGVGEFIYLKGVASTVEGSFVTFDEAFETALLAANAIGGVGIALAATVASTYGWYQIGGKAAGKVLAAFADNGLVYATATAGSADDAAVAGDRVKGALGRSAIDTPATGFAWIQFYARPYMDDGAAA